MKKSKKIYVLTLYDRNKKTIVQRETRRSEQAFDRLWCMALGNVNTLKYKMLATIEDEV